MLKHLRLISSWWSSFCVAFSAVNWPGAVWLEWNVTFLSAVSAGCLMHLAITVWHFCYFNSYNICVQKLLHAQDHYRVLHPYKLHASHSEIGHDKTFLNGLIWQKKFIFRFLGKKKTFKKAIPPNKANSSILHDERLTKPFHSQPNIG